jgi:hypothetical protein
MRRWLTVSTGAASSVADQSSLWLPGALAWMMTVGWLALLVGVTRTPTTSELTFLGPGIVTSGAWPWNGIALAGAALLLVAGFIALASVAEAVLLHGRRAGIAEVRTVFVVGVVCATPFVVALAAAVIVGLPAVAPGEFNDPNAGGGAVLQTIVALGPFVAAMILAAVLGAAFHAAAIRSPDDDGGLWHALAGAPGRLGRAGATAVAQVVALLAARIGYLLFVAVLLRVLWAPIEERLGRDGFGLAPTLLLVGFVAIWLCLVLAGGALHAWGSVSWTRLLDARGREAGAVAQMESRSRP